jgi:hypothetical protein
MYDPIKAKAVPEFPEDLFAEIAAFRALLNRALS